MNNLTIIIAVGPYHAQIATQAIVSANSQSIPCDVIVIDDKEGRGAGWARNRGLMQAVTPLCTFLDADDILDPHFAEVALEGLAEYGRSHIAPRYAYTDWLGDGNAPIIAPLPCEAWTERTFHLVTAVVPTERARMIGGFDEAMAGLEDADFYLRLRLSGVCGLHIHSPSNPLNTALVSYREGGQRSIQARQSGQETLIQQYMSNRYGGYNLMGCCGDSTQHPPTPGNEPQEGWILVQAQWHGNRTERGRATGRLYPRTSHPHLMYVDPRDVTAAPQHWQPMKTPMQAANGVVLQPAYQTGAQTWQTVANALYGGSMPPQPVSNPIEYKPNVSGRKKADLIKSAQGRVKVEGDIE